MTPQGSVHTNEDRIGYLLDKTVDPCESFYQFACSNKKRGRPYPYARPKIIQDLQQLIRKDSSTLMASFLYG